MGRKRPQQDNREREGGRPHHVWSQHERRQHERPHQQQGVNRNKIKSLSAELVSKTFYLGPAILLTTCPVLLWNGADAAMVQVAHAPSLRHRAVPSGELLCHDPVPTERTRCH